MKILLTLLASTLLLTACTTHSTASQSGYTPKLPPSQGSKPPMAQPTVTLPSNYNFNDTVNRLQSAFTSKGMTIFAVIDHAAAAKNAGLEMQPATVIVYGTPKVGTPLMIKDPTFALQLPLKVLVTEVNGQVQVSFMPSEVLVKGSKITHRDVMNTLAAAEKLIAATIQ